MTPAMLAFESAPVERRHGDYLLSTDRARLDLPAIHRFLTAESYWALGVERSLVDRAIANSLPAAAYAGNGALVGFARLVTDGAAFAYLRDVFVLEAHRGRGLGRALSALLLDHPDLGSVRNWMLATKDAHALYATLGFAPLADPSLIMQMRRIASG